MNVINAALIVLSDRKLPSTRDTFLPLIREKQLSHLF